jgi:quinol monooxygenase YgiN
MPEIIAIGLLKARPGMEDATRAALATLVVPTQAEEGCILYALHQGVEDPTRFAFVERWESQELHAAHVGSPQLAAALARAGELLAEPPDSAVYRALPQGEATKGSLTGHALPGSEAACPPGWPGSCAPA